MTRNHWIPLGALTLVALFATSAAQAQVADGAERHRNTRHVECGRGQTITRALELLQDRKDPITITFEGTCTEAPSITRDDVVLEGKGVDPTIVGKVSILGASRVTIQGFTVRNSFESGVDCVRGAGCTIRNVISRDNPRRCIYIEGSSAELVDTQTYRCEIGVFNRSAHVQFGGSIVSNENSVAGISASTGGSFVALNANITTNNNTLGFVNQLSSETTFANGSITANNNTVHGISLTSQGVFVHGTINVTANNNGGFGLLIVEGSTWSSFVTFNSSTNFNGNGAGGALAASRSQMTLTGAVTVTGNQGFGVWADDSYLSLTNTTATGNVAGDARLSFRSTGASGANVVFGTPYLCDTSVATRGPKTCGSAAPTGVADRSTEAIADYLAVFALLEK
jgi:hypothetical protein